MTPGGPAPRRLLDFLGPADCSSSSSSSSSNNVIVIIIIMFIITLKPKY